LIDLLDGETKYYYYFVVFELLLFCLFIYGYMFGLTRNERYSRAIQEHGKFIDKQTFIKYHYGAKFFGPLVAVVIDPRHELMSHYAIQLTEFLNKYDTFKTYSFLFLKRHFDAGTNRRSLSPLFVEHYSRLVKMQEHLDQLVIKSTELLSASNLLDYTEDLLNFVEVWDSQLKDLESYYNLAYYFHLEALPTRINEYIHNLKRALFPLNKINSDSCKSLVELLVSSPETVFDTVPLEVKSYLLMTSWDSHYKVLFMRQKKINILNKELLKRSWPSSAVLTPPASNTTLKNLSLLGAFLFLSGFLDFVISNLDFYFLWLGNDVPKPLTSKEMATLCFTDPDYFFKNHTNSKLLKAYFFIKDNKEFLGGGGLWALSKVVYSGKLNYYSFTRKGTFKKLYAKAAEAQTDSGISFVHNCEQGMLTYSSYLKLGFVERLVVANTDKMWNLLERDRTFLGMHNVVGAFPGNPDYIAQFNDVMGIVKSMYIDKEQIAKIEAFSNTQLRLLNQKNFDALHPISKEFLTILTKPASQQVQFFQSPGFQLNRNRYFAALGRNILFDGNGLPNPMSHVAKSYFESPISSSNA
jgi:hypothetical protein